MAFVWLSLFAPLSLNNIRSLPCLGSAVALAIAVVSGAALFREVAPSLLASVGPPTHSQWVAAMQLRRLRLQPGDRVAVLGHTTVAEYWAHLGGFTIVA